MLVTFNCALQSGSQNHILKNSSSSLPRCPFQVVYYAREVSSLEGTGVCFPQILQEETSQACIRQPSGVAKKRVCDLERREDKVEKSRTERANEQASMFACQFDW